jgi:prolipoprotein diacylglyceryltransferase
MSWSLILPASLALPVHQVFEALGLAVGAQYYRVLARRSGQGGWLTSGRFAVVVGCLLGAGIGNKAVFWLDQPHLWPLLTQDWTRVFGGQSVVGGLLGGLLGVEMAKRLTGQTRSTGDAFVFPCLLGLMIGRIGCLLAGLHDDTYGVPTSMPWGVDLGDGVPRHPTQLYEIGFCLLLWPLFRRWQPHLACEPGLLFKAWLWVYLLWRLLIDGLKPVPDAYPGGLSGIQWVCLLALLLYSPLCWRSFRRWQHQPV